MRRAGPTPLPMIGRERERAEFSADLAAAAAGRGRAAIILGEAGMGKSMLADWLAWQAVETGFRVLRGGCSAAAMLPLWPWRLLLRDVDPGNRVPLLAPAGAALSASDRELAAATIVDAVATAARTQPLLLVLEDLHWSDPASTQVARLLADTVAALPMLLVLTVRDDPAEATEEIRALIADLSTGVRRVRLTPLDPAEVARLAADTLGAPLADMTAQELAARTGGNPFFVHEVTRLLAAHGPDAAMIVPPGVREVLQRRVARLSQPCATLLTIAALDAATTADLIDLDVVRTAGGLDDADATRVLDEAVAARLVDLDRTAASPYRFRHALIREVFASGLPHAEEGRLHAELAVAIEARDEDPPPAARLAHHWSLASGSQAAAKSVRWSLQAARDAVTGYGFEAAIGHYRRVLAATPASRASGLQVDPVVVAIEFGEALQLAGDEVASRDVLVAAARDAATGGRAVQLAKAALALGGGLAGFEVPTWDERQAELLRLADAALPADEVALRAAVRGRLSLALTGRAPLTERVRLAEDAVRLIADCDDAQVEAAVLAAYCDAISGPDFVAERIAAAERIRTLAIERLPATLHRETTVLLAHRLLVLGQLELGEFSAAEKQMADYEQLAGRLGVRRYLWWPEIWRGMRALLDGHPDRALQQAEAAEDLGRRSYNAEMMGFTLRLEAHRVQGTVPTYAAAISDLLDRLGHTALPAMYYASPARALLATGEADQARRVLRTLLTGDQNARPKDAEWLECHWAMVDCALALDHRAAAAALFTELRPYEALWAVDGIGAVVFGNLAEQLGRLADYLGDAAEAARYLALARDRYEAADTRALLARLDQASDRHEPPTSNGREATITGRFRRDGAIWHLEWRGRRSTLPDAKGMHDLAILLTHPGRAVPAVELVQAESGVPAVASGGDLGPMLDESATRAYRRRITELDQEIDEADLDADLGRAEQLRAERAALIDELTAAFGLGGRPRRTGDPAERARTTVTMRIRSAIRSIGERDEALGRHLGNAVRTGRLCSYDPEENVDWRSPLT